MFVYQVCVCTRQPEMKMGKIPKKVYSKIAGTVHVLEHTVLKVALIAQKTSAKTISKLLESFPIVQESRLWNQNKLVTCRKNLINFLLRRDGEPPNGWSWSPRLVLTKAQQPYRDKNLYVKKCTAIFPKIKFWGIDFDRLPFTTKFDNNNWKRLFNFFVNQCLDSLLIVRCGLTKTVSNRLELIKFE